MLGRTFEDGEDRSGNTRVAVLSYDFWVHRYGGLRDVLDKPLLLDDIAFRIVGIMPAEFGYPAPEVALWIPMRFDPRFALLATIRQVSHQCC